MTPLTGYLFALGSALCNGSFASLSKCSTEDLSPVYFNACLSFGVTLSSWIFAFTYYKEFSDVILFDPLAASGGCLLVMANYFAFLAIPRAGLALSQGVWGGVALVVSFIWGVYGPTPIGKSPKSMLGSYAGVFCILFGIVGIAQNDALTKYICKSSKEGPISSSLLGEDGVHTHRGVKEEESYYIAIDERTNRIARISADNQTGAAMSSQNSSNGIKMGLLYAMCTGLFGGSILVPLELSSVSGLDSLPSFGHGVFLSSFLITILFALSSGSSQPLPKTARNIVPGIISGCIFNAGNTMSILAIPSIGFAVAQPLMQCALFVSGLLGIFLFREIQDTKRIFVFFLCGIILIGGAVVLALFGP